MASIRCPKEPTTCVLLLLLLLLLQLLLLLLLLLLLHAKNSSLMPQEAEPLTHAFEPLCCRQSSIK